MTETKFQRMARAWWNAHWAQQDGAAIASLAQLLERAAEQALYDAGVVTRAAMEEGENDAASGVVATHRNKGSRPEAPWPQNRSAEAGTPVDSTAGPALPNDGDDVRTGHHSQAATPSPPHEDAYEETMRESHKHLPVAMAYEPRGDDLVARLRRLAKYKHDDHSIGDEAADRIEQLEEELRVSRMNEMHEVPEGQRGRE